MLIAWSPPTGSPEDSWKEIGPQITQPKKWTTCAKNLPQIFEWIFLGFPWIFHGFPWIILGFSMDSGKKSGGRAGNRTGGRAGGNSNGLPGKSGISRIFQEILENPGFFLAVAGPSAKKMTGQWKMSPETIFLPKK